MDSEDFDMSTRELITKLRRWARRRNVAFDVKVNESKGSHRRLYLGDRNTTVPWKTDLTTGVVRGILKQLDVDDLP